MGSFNGQNSPGKYMHPYLYENLKKMAAKISKDMTFLGIIYSSTLEVGTGKSVLATQIGEAWTEIINEMYNLNIPYSVNNIVWRPEELIKRSFEITKYSFILLDEWEDASYWSKLGMTLRQFFRKCRQLNLFMICIIPNWFQLPLHYAVSRSIFAIDVKFDDNLERGNFAFYNFPDKRKLYIIGKKTHNYYCTKSTFAGNFTDGYGVDEEEYRKKKYEDMLKYDEENPEAMTKSQIETNVYRKIMPKLKEYFKDTSNKKFGELFEVSERTINRWNRGVLAGTTP